MTAAPAKPSPLMQFVCYNYVLIATFLSCLMCVGGAGEVALDIGTAQTADNANLRHQAATTHFSVENLMLSADNGIDVSHLAFQPSILDFHELPVGDADSDVVTIFNKHTNRSVFLASISGNVPDFYSSFFQEQTIPPMGNTTFNVVFLPRQQGSIHTHLFIHTSFGLLNYTLKGKGVECLFRLNPLVGLRAPFNATLTPEIYMYNPYSTPLQIVEVYSSGGQFQLELPSGGPEGPQALWEIPPYSSKPVIRVRFKATAAGNHTAYIRIKVSADNNSELEDVVLVVPIEVEIFNDTGIYSEMPFINFGLGGTNDKPKEMVLELLSSGPATMDIDTYYVEGDQNISAAISVEITTDLTANNAPCHLVTATVDWSKIKTERYFKGHITIRALLSNNHITIHRIPFVGEIINGSIYYNESHTRFVTTAKVTKSTKDFILKNNFQVSLAITNVTMSEDTARYFKTSGFVPKVLLPGEEAPLFKISQLPTAAKKPTTKVFLLHTNTSIYEVPVSTYNGLLRRIVPVDESTVNGIGIDEKAINYGTLPLSTVTDTVLGFVNDSPVPITIHNWTATISDVASIIVILRGCGNLTMDNLKFCYSIQPKEWILFQVSVLANAVGAFVGKLSVKTDYEELVTPVRFTTAMGRLQFSATMLDESRCFPGGLCSVNLTAYSTFLQSMTVKEILVNVTGITYDYSNGDFPAIAPNELTHIGQLQFSPKSICGEECYLEFPDLLAPSVISANCKSKENDLMNAKLEAFRSMRASFSAITFRVQTNQVRRYDFNGSANLIWPKLIAAGPIEFPTFQVGEEVIEHITVNNPTDQIIKVHYMIHDVAQNGASMTYPPEIIGLCWDCFLSKENVFSLVDMKDGRHGTFDYIPPRSSVKIAIQFSTENAGSYANLLYIRNNFTVLEAVWLTATAAPYQFKFGNRKPGSETPLVFELADKHFRDCDRKSEADRSPIMITAKRTFTAKNMGDVPIDVKTMKIEGIPCEGYGFRILECGNFRLPPNTSKKIDILFTPDFTLARISRLLSIETSLNYAINYTLLSMVPANALHVCSRAIDRPIWEAQMQYISFGVLTVAFLLVLLASFFDSDKVLKDHVDNMSKDKGPVEPALDLREVGMRRNSGTVFEDGKSAITENGNGNATKPFIYLRKKPVKKLEADVVADSNKKSWANVLARKFSPIKSDVKFRESNTPTPPLNYRAEFRRQAAMGNSDNNKRNLTKDIMDAIELAAKLIDDDASSTTTENSLQSSEASFAADKKFVSPGKKTQPVDSPLAGPDATKTKYKSAVKKAKSLPLNSPAEVNTAPAATAPKPVKAQNNAKTQNGKYFRTQSNITTPEYVVYQKRPDVSSYLYVNSPKDQLPNANNVDPDKFPGNQRKYGKTPGRERRKHDSTPAASRKTTSQKTPTSATATAPKGNAFQFSSPLTHVPLPLTTTVSSIWDNKLSFSNIVAQNPPISPPAPIEMNATSTPKPTSAAVIAKPSSQNKVGKLTAKSLFQHFSNIDNATGTKDKLNDEAFKQMENACEEIITDDIQYGVDLGPIGTRKSPSNTPVWETMPSIQKPVATMNGNPNSFFSAEFPQYANTYNGIDLNSAATSNIDLGGVAGLFDDVYGQHLSQKQRVWDPSTLISLLQQQHQQLQQHQTTDTLITPSLLQQQQQQQSHPLHQPQHQQQQQQLRNQSSILNNHHLNQLIQPQSLHFAQHQQQQQQPTLYSNTSTLWGSNYTQSGWMQGPIRPPPGLEPLREQHHLHNRHHTAQETNNLHNGNNADVDAAQLLPAFDIFGSMSAIWSSDSLPSVTNTAGGVAATAATTNARNSTSTDKNNKN